MPRGMPGARSGGSGSGGDGTNSGRSSGDSGGAVTVWEVVSLLGKLLGTVAALKVVLYLLRVCFAMAWKSGGASHSELIHNLRSKCHPRPAWATEKGQAWTLAVRPSPPQPPHPRLTVRNVRSAPLRLLEGVCARLHRESRAACVCGPPPPPRPGTCHSARWTGRGAKPPGGCWLRVGRGSRLLAGLAGTGCGTGGGAVAGVCRPTGEGRDLGMGKCGARVPGDWAGTEGTPPSQPAGLFSHCPPR